jgi:protein gp37
VLNLHRLADARKFTPIVEADGRRRPRLVFINSMSDWAHDAIPDDVLHQVFDVMEGTPQTIYQCLTKRPVRARKFLVERYKSGIPANIWIGCSVEDNRVAARLNIMRSIRERTGDGTFFVSVEPIVGPTDALDFDGIDWVITGGESGPKARVMQRDWLMGAVNAARKADIALWHKQAGQILSHPNLDRAPAALAIKAKYQWLIDNGWERLKDEKGGATIDKNTYRQMPPHYHALTSRLNEQASLI